MTTEESPKLTLLRGGGGEEESGSASTIYGPVRAGLTTPQPTNKVAQLSESLNYLERRTEDLEFRYSKVLDILVQDILPRVVRLLSIEKMDTTEEEE
jgi:hypothetical protein